MKKNIINIILLIIPLLFSHSQMADGFILYGTESSTTQIADKNASSEMNMIKEALNKFKDIEFKLFFNGKESIFRVVNTLDTNDFKLKIARSLFGAHSEYYENRKTKEKYRFTQAYGERFIITERKVKWLLTKESKKIDDYLCYKATTEKIIENSRGRFKKDVVAWYTNEIPLSFGPRGYSGLPGLILELTEGDLLFYTKEISLNIKEEIKINKPVKGKKLTEIEFEDIGKNMGSRF